MKKYRDFIRGKEQSEKNHGFEPVWIPDMALDFQKSLIEWSVRKGRAALFADCGLGKTLMQLAWAENIVRKTNKRVLILTPLAVSYQFEREGEKFGVDCYRSDGELLTGRNIVVTNYEKLTRFDPKDFIAVDCDESSILKNFDGKIKSIVTEFMRNIPYRLCCTATAAPNDYDELGTTSEALGYLGYQDMLSRFFKEDTIKDYLGWGRKAYRFRGHSQEAFWRWVVSWARACRKPSDLGFDDGQLLLPPLVEREIVIESAIARPGMLFAMPAKDLREQRVEKKMTLEHRCQSAANIANDQSKGASVVWCHLDEEAATLSKMIPDAVEVSGKMQPEEKERRLVGFQNGDFRVLITKPKIGCYGLNWQHCANVITFPSHSWEQYYQSVRRCWRFGQKKSVEVSIVTTEGELGVLKNLQRKSKQAETMFAELTANMGKELGIDRVDVFSKKEKVPSWLAKTK